MMKFGDSSDRIGRISSQAILVSLLNRMLLEIRIEAFEKVDVLKKLFEIFQKLNQAEVISGDLSLLGQQYDKSVYH